MCALPHPNRWTTEDYLTFEREQKDIKHELIDGEIYAMSGASRQHNIITSNVNGLLFNQLGNRQYEHYAADMKIHNPMTDSFMYPDISVVCGDVKLHDEKSDVLLNPAVIIEVLSPSTENFDRGTKFAHYRTIPSLQEYILIEQDAPKAEQRTRQPDNTWILRDIEGMDAMINLKSIACKLTLKDVYRKISFD
jgi:Uma2 family endonuclease